MAFHPHTRPSALISWTRRPFTHKLHPAMLVWAILLIGWTVLAQPGHGPATHKLRTSLFPIHYWPGQHLNPHLYHSQYQRWTGAGSGL